MRKIFVFCLVLCSLKSTSQINTQTGSSEYNLNICNHSDLKSGLGTSIVLNYSSNQGLLLNQVASNVGLGWSLLAGGEIIRIQNGEPDDQYNPEVVVNNMSDADASNNIDQAVNPVLYEKYYPNGFLYAKYPKDYIPKQLGFIPRYNSTTSDKYKVAPKAAEDREQDYFIFQLNGSSKRFVIGKNSQSKFETKFEDNSFLSAQILDEAQTDQSLYQQGIVTKIKGFVIKDENGLIYTFDKYDLDQVMETGRGNFRCYNDCSSIKPYQQNPTGKYVINRWVLTSIKDPITSRMISFDYNTENWKYVSQISETLNTMTDEGNSNNTHKVTSYTIGSIFSNKLVLKNIVFPDGYNVVINYNTGTRLDLDGSKNIVSIDLRWNNSNYETWYFDANYFYEKNIVASAGSQSYDDLLSYFPGSDDKYLDMSKIYEAYKYRLCLSGVRLSVPNSTQIKQYKFKYFTGDESDDAYDKVPSRFETKYISTFPFTPLLQDWSGHYDKDVLNFTDNRSLGNRYSAKMGLLKEIDEPSKKSIAYNYNIWPTFALKNAVLVDSITITDQLNLQSYKKVYSYSGSTYLTGAISQLADMVYTAQSTGDNINYQTSAIDYTRYKDDDYEGSAPTTKSTFGNKVLNMALGDLFPGSV